MNIFFQVKHTKAILSNSTRKLLRFEIRAKCASQFRNKFDVSFELQFSAHFRCLLRFVIWRSDSARCITTVMWAAAAAPAAAAAADAADSCLS